MCQSRCESFWGSVANGANGQLFYFTPMTSDMSLGKKIWHGTKTVTSTLVAGTAATCVFLLPEVCKKLTGYDFTCNSDQCAYISPAMRSGAAIYAFRKVQCTFLGKEYLMHKIDSKIEKEEDKIESALTSIKQEGNSHVYQLVKILKHQDQQIKSLEEKVKKLEADKNPSSSTAHIALTMSQASSPSSSGSNTLDTTASPVHSSSTSSSSSTTSPLSSPDSTTSLLSPISSLMAQLPQAPRPAPAPTPAPLPTPYYSKP